jgi:hypothetical protein
MDALLEGSCFRFPQLSNIGLYGPTHTALIFGHGLHSRQARPFVEFGGAMSYRGSIARQVEGPACKARRTFGGSRTALAAVAGRCGAKPCDRQREARLNPHSVASCQKAGLGESGTRLRRSTEKEGGQATANRLDDRRNEPDARCGRKAGRDVQDERDRSSGLLVDSDSILLRDRESAGCGVGGKSYGSGFDRWNRHPAERMLQDAAGTASQTESNATVENTVAFDGSGICLALVVEPSAIVVLFEVDPEAGWITSRSAIVVPSNSADDGHLVGGAWRSRFGSTDARPFVITNDGRAVYRSSVLSASSGRRCSARSAAGLIHSKKSLVMRRGGAEALRPDAAGACGPNRRSPRRSPRRVTSGFLKGNLKMRRSRKKNRPNKPLLCGVDNQAPPQTDVTITRTQEELLDAYFLTRLGSHEATVLLTQARFATRLTRGKFDVSEDDE